VGAHLSEIAGKSSSTDQYLSLALSSAAETIATQNQASEKQASENRS
jgi:small nuclear ribonucleoprotein (snRNP)-like protein